MGENIALTAADGFRLNAYRAKPAGQARAGLVVIQEIFGVNGHIRSVCDRYAQTGFLVVAPALYDRIETGIELDYLPDEVTLGREFKAKTEMAKVIQDVVAAADAAAEGGKVGIVGYCWGGLVTYVSACRLGDRLACASGYYGGGIVDYLEEKPAIPLLLHFGTQDASIPLADVEKIRAANHQLSIHTYEGAEHGFNCDRRKQHHPEAAKLALDRTLAHFTEHLG